MKEHARPKTRKNDQREQMSSRNAHNKRAWREVNSYFKFITPTFIKMRIHVESHTDFETVRVSHY